MSETGKTLMGTFGMTDMLMPLVLEDLSDEQARRRSRGDEGPSVAWIVGHLLHYRHYVLGLFGEAGEPPVGEAFTQDATDGSDYPSVEDFQRLWTETAEAFRAVLESKSEEEWNAPGSGAHDEQSLRDQVTFFAWHEGYHMGAIGALRKSMGLPGPAEKVMAVREAEGG